MPHTLPSLNALRAFESAARHENMSRAADELHVTHGAISRQIRALESQLGVRLFQRRGRGLALTPAGLHLRDAASDSFARLRQACTEIGSGVHSAPFVLGCPGSLLARWMIPRLERLQHDLPELHVHLSMQEGQPAGELERLDAALLMDAPPWPSHWHVATLAPERIGPVLSPRYPGWAKLRDRPASSLLQEPVLHTTSRPQAWPAWASAAGLSSVPPQAGQDFAHLYPLIEAAIAGLGVAIAPAPLVADELEAGRLIAPWGFLATDASWVLASGQRGKDDRFGKLAGWLREALAGD